jgi:hypothetical protein
MMPCEWPGAMATAPDCCSTPLERSRARSSNIRIARSINVARELFQSVPRIVRGLRRTLLDVSNIVSSPKSRPSRPLPIPKEFGTCRS